ncbi:MAG: FRG domain-containing protein [bacterium]
MKKIRKYTIYSIQDFLEHIENVYAPNDHFLRSLFRGQHNDLWEIIPSLFRIESNHNFELLENHFLDGFKRMSRGMLKHLPDNELEWLTLAQHHGLPTRLIDWTYNPLIALYFSVENFSIDGALFHIVVEDKKLFELQGVKSKSMDFKIPRYLKPDHISKRISTQSACFLEFPVFEDCPVSLKEYYEDEENNELHDYRKLIIPCKSKSLIKKQLDDLGINEFTVFPDLDGLSRFLKADKRI